MSERKQAENRSAIRPFYDRILWFESCPVPRVIPPANYWVLLSEKSRSHSDLPLLYMFLSLWSRKRV